MESINLEEFGRRIFKAKNSPSTLDDLNLQLTSWFSYYSEQLNTLELFEAKFWQDNKKGRRKQG